MTRAPVPLVQNEEGRPLAVVCAASVLAADFASLGSECKSVVNFGADWLHVDVMVRRPFLASTCYLEMLYV